MHFYNARLVYFPPDLFPPFFGRKMPASNLSKYGWFISPPPFWAGLELKTTYFLCRNLKKNGSFFCPKWTFLNSILDNFHLAFN